MALDYPILVQGTAPRTAAAQQFRETPHAVLFATSSFWQGVDVVGEALSCVIVDKLPFASPADPITSARIDAIRARGGEPFDEYQVPLAILALQQGLGRLIRHRRDRGVLAVLDPRLRTKGYGRRFLASLPPAPVVHELGAVEALSVDRVRYNPRSSYVFFFGTIGGALWSAEHGRPIWLLLIGLLRLAIAAPAAAQPGGMIRGMVRDVKGQPVEGAVVTMIMADTGRKFTVKTNRQGEYHADRPRRRRLHRAGREGQAGVDDREDGASGSARRRTSTWCSARCRQPPPQPTRRSSRRRARS